MQSIGVLSVFLFLGSLAAFMLMFMSPAWQMTGGTVGAILLALATVLLGITIRKRNRTERI